MVCRKRHGYLILIRHTQIFNAPNYYSYQIFNVEVKCFINSFSPEKIENYNFEIPTIPQTLNINNKRTASAKSINWMFFRKLIKYSLKQVLLKAIFSPLSRYCCSKLDRYYDPLCGSQAKKGLKGVVWDFNNFTL